MIDRSQSCTMPEGYGNIRQLAGFMLPLDCISSERYLFIFYCTFSVTKQLELKD